MKAVFPEEIEDEIRKKLPIKSLKRFASVNKRWHSSIQCPSFIKQYNAHQSKTNRTPKKILCFRKDPVTKTLVLSLRDQDSADWIEDLDFPPFVKDRLEKKGDKIFYKKRLKEYEFHRDVHMFGPINGVYLIYHRLIERLAGTLTLWNPSTREYKHITPEISFPVSPNVLYSCWFRGDHDRIAEPERFEIGFGFDHSTGDYKIVVICVWCMIYCFCERKWNARVYNNATQSWRTIFSIDESEVNSPIDDFEGDYPFPMIDCNYTGFNNCFLHGVYHWSCTLEPYPDDDAKVHILTFDMATEEFRLMSGLPISAREYGYRGVWVCREKLTMIAASHENRNIAVWMMMDYGVAESWSLHYSIEMAGPIDGLRVTGMTDNGRIYFGDNNVQLISYDLDSHQVKEHGVFSMYDKIRFRGFSGFFGTLGVVDYVENLAPVSLKGHSLKDV